MNSVIPEGFELAPGWTTRENNCGCDHCRQDLVYEHDEKTSEFSTEAAVKAGAIRPTAKAKLPKPAEGMMAKNGRLNTRMRGRHDDPR